MRLFSKAVQVAQEPVAQQAQPPVIYTPDGVNLTVETAPRMYITQVYCCICEPGGQHVKFDIALPKGVPPTGFRVSCPNCEVSGVVNHLGQVWPERRYV